MKQGNICRKLRVCVVMVCCFAAENLLATSQKEVLRANAAAPVAEVSKDIDEVSVGRGKRKIVDKIMVRVNGRNILLSDLQQPRIDTAESYTLEEAIDHEILFQKAAERKLLPTPLDVEKYIAMWKETHNLMHLTPEQFEKRLQHDGLTMRRFRNQLYRVLAIRNLRQLEISEQVVVTSREIEQHYKTYPEYSQDRYLLQTKIVPYSMAKNEKEAHGKLKKLSWIAVDWIEKPQLAERMVFVTQMKEGEVSMPVKVEQGFQFVKLVKFEQGHLKTLEERWGEIERVLQNEKMEKFEKEYVETLRTKALVVYLR